MSILSFLNASNNLYNNNFYEEAFCLVCAALDAAAKEQYPDIKTVGERYKRFISANFRIICNKGFPGISADSIRIKVIDARIHDLKLDENGYVGMEDIIYYSIRCGLVHDCAINQAIKFTDNTYIGNWENGLFLLPRSIILGLVDAIKMSLSQR